MKLNIMHNVQSLDNGLLDSKFLINFHRIYKNNKGNEVSSQQAKQNIKELNMWKNQRNPYIPLHTSLTMLLKICYWTSLNVKYWGAKNGIAENIVIVKKILKITKNNS